MSCAKKVVRDVLGRRSVRWVIGKSCDKNTGNICGWNYYSKKSKNKTSKVRTKNKC